MKFKSLTRHFAFSAIVGLSLCGATAFADTLFAADNTAIGLSGVVTLNPATMTQTGSFLTSGPISGLAANSETDVYVSISSGVYHYDTSGNVLQSYNPFPADQFFDLSLAGGNLLAVDNTTVGLQGVVIFNAATLGVAGSFTTPDPLNGLAAGSANDAYVSSGSGIFHYDLSGNLLNSFNMFPADGFGDLFLRGNTLYAVDNTTIAGLQGVVAFDATTLTILSSFLTNDITTGLTGDSTDLYNSQLNGVFKTDVNGNALGTFNPFPADAFFDLAYAKTAVPEPGTFAVMGLGVAVLLRRRAKK